MNAIERKGISYSEYELAEFLEKKKADFGRAKLHIALLGSREHRHLVAKNYETDKIILNVWLKKDDIILTFESILQNILWW